MKGGESCEGRGHGKNRRRNTVEERERERERRNVILVDGKDGKEQEINISTTSPQEEGGWHTYAFPHLSTTLSATVPPLGRRIVG